MEVFVLDAKNLASMLLWQHALLGASAVRSRILEVIWGRRVFVRGQGVTKSWILGIIGGTMDSVSDVKNGGSAQIIPLNHTAINGKMLRVVVEGKNVITAGLAEINHLGKIRVPDA